MLLPCADCDTITVNMVSACGPSHSPQSPRQFEEVRRMAPAAPESTDPPELLTLDELTQRVGMSVRNIRFYTTKRLVPPPLRRGRSGYYSADHVARLELVRELQNHGF